MSSHTGSLSTTIDAVVFYPSTRTRGGALSSPIDVTVFYPSTRSRSGTLGSTMDVTVFFPSSRVRNGSWTRNSNTEALPDLESPMSIVQVLQNTATTVSVFMRDVATGLGKPGIPTAFFIIKQKKSNQSSFSVIAPTVTDVGLGWYDLSLTTGHTDTYGKSPLDIFAPNAMTRDDVVLDIIAMNQFTDPVRAGLSALAPSALASAILDAARSGHVTLGTVGEGIALATSLLQGNFYMDEVDNTDPNGQTSARIRCFLTGTAAASATPGGTGEGEFATFVVTTTYSGPSKVTAHRAVQQ